MTPFKSSILHLNRGSRTGGVFIYRGGIFRGQEFWQPRSRRVDEDRVIKKSEKTIIHYGERERERKR